MCLSLHNLPPRPLIMPLSTRQSTAKSKSSSEFLFPEDIENLTAFIEEQEHSEPSGAKPKKSSTKSKKKDKAPTPPAQPDQSASVENLILLETLRKENLATELKIAEAKLELTKLSANSSLVAPPPVSPVKLQRVITPCSTPAAPVQQFTTLDQLRTKKKTSTSLPNNYLFSAKGTVDYDKLDLAEFVSGFLEFCKEQPESSKPSLLAHLQLLMDRAITYSWSSVRNFHFSVHNAIEQGRLAWSRSDAIRDRAQTFFTHQDLRSNATIPSRPNGNSQVRSRAKDNYCKEWNYSGKCNCNISDASYKLVHRCRVCDSLEHAMLNCAKRKYPIPSHQPSTSSAEQSS